MNLSITGNTLFTYSESSTSVALFLQNQFMNENRSCDLRDKPIFVHSKSPAEVFGERIIRPLVSATVDLSGHTWRVVKKGFLFLDRCLSGIMHPLPGAEASLTCRNESLDEESIPLTCINPNKICTPLRTFWKVANQYHGRLSQLPNPYSNLKLLPSSGVSSVGVSLDIDVKRKENAQRYIEHKTRKPAPKIEHHCLGQDSIQHIREIKNPTPGQKVLLKDAYAELERLANADALAPCNQKLAELFHHVVKEYKQYSISALHPMPELLATLLNWSGASHTFNELEELTAKIHEIALVMIPVLSSTNDYEALLRWVEVMLDSAARKNEFLSPTFNVAMQLLQSKMGDNIKSEQKRTLRRLATWHVNNPLVGQDKEIADKLLLLCSSQIWSVRVLFSYLESIPDDIKRLDEILQEAGAALSNCRTVQDVTALTIVMILCRMGPDRVRKAGLATIMALVLGRIIYIRAGFK